MQSPNSLNSRLLVAMPWVDDPAFGGPGSVIYVYEHDITGAKGLVINKPSEYTLGDLLEKLDIPLKQPNFSDKPVLIGGMDQREKGTILAACDSELMLSTAREALEGIASGEWCPDDFLITLGCVSWGMGELEQEIAGNYWLVMSAAHHLLFDDPFTVRWHNAALAMGVNLNLIPREVGSA